MMVPLQSRRSVAPEIATDVLVGLTSTPKWLPPRLFYDSEGSELFERITQLPEYYLTRTERMILEQHADHIVQAAGSGLTFVELGAGTAAKTKLLLKAALRRQLAVTFYPVDVSSTALSTAKRQIEGDLARVSVRPLVGDYLRGLDRLKQVTGRKLILFIGSSIGNYEPYEAKRLLQSVRSSLRQGDALLLGTDMVKDVELLRAAYNDSVGVTAAFNLNMLARINRELDADFILSFFEHVAEWNPERLRIEMYLASKREQAVSIPSLGIEVHFGPGERIHTENSHKFTPESVESMVTSGGFAVEQQWMDEKQWFGLYLARAV